MTNEEKKAIMAEYATHEGDTGSPEVQIAILTKRINDLNEHFKVHHKTTIQEEVSSNLLVTEETFLHIFRRLILNVTVQSSQDSESVNKYSQWAGKSFIGICLPLFE